MSGGGEAELVYLQHLEEARRWMEVVLATPLPPVAEFESRLNSGVLLCQLGERFCPEEPMWKKVYDRDETKFKMRGVDYRHTDNINFFLAFLKKVGLPKIFHPSTLDVYERKNLPRLVYCLHCLSHLLECQGMVPQAVEKMQGDIFSEHDVKQVAQTIRRGDVPRDLKAIHVAKQLVHEELQYAEMGMEGEDEEGGEDDPSNEDEDADIYDTFQGIQAPEGNSVVAMDTTDKLVAYLSCGISRVTVKVYARSIPTAAKQSPVDRVLSVLMLAVVKGEAEAVTKLLCSSHLGLDRVYTSLEMAQRYTTALAAARRPTMPSSVTCVYTGLTREGCDEVLEKASPGAYLLRESMTRPGQLVVSFRNKAGIKHWQIRTQNGQYTWGQSPAFPSIEAFTQNFCPSLSKATGLRVFPTASEELAVRDWEGVGKLLELSTAESGFPLEQVLAVVGEVNREVQVRHHDALLREQQQQQRGVEAELARQRTVQSEHDSVQQTLMQRLEEQTQRIKELEERLAATHGEGQGGVALNFQNRKEGGLEEGAGPRASPRAAPRRNHPHPTHPEAGQVRAQPSLEGTEEGNGVRQWKGHVTHGGDWDSSMILHVGRGGAEKILNKYGRPGSFLVRPSERSQSDHAIVFKTETEVRNWKVTMAEGKFTVKPYPQTFSSLEDVVMLFVQAVGEANHLTLTPLVLPKSVMDELLGYGTVQKAASTDLDAPAQLVASASSDHTNSPDLPSLKDETPDDPRDWSPLQVSQWMFERGLEQFVDTFLEHSIDGACLLCLSHEQLRDDLSISALGHRHRILRSVKELQEGKET